MNRSETQNDRFDLLPFIAILMCVLGCLLLVTISMSAISMGVSAGEAWIPKHGGGNDTASFDKIPILVEWDGRDTTFHFMEGLLTAPCDLSEKKGEGKDNAAFKEYLARIYDIRDTHYALIAIRPTGFSNFDDLAKIFRDTGIKIGYEPLNQDRKVKLRLSAEF